MDIRKPATKELQASTVTKRKQSATNKKKSSTSKRKIKIILVFILALLLFIGLVFLSRLDSLTIKNIEVNGAHNDVTKSAIQKNIENYLNQKTAFVFPNRNIAFARSARIEHIISSSFPLVESISVTKTGTHTLSVSLKERTPVFSVDGYNGMYVDGTGYIFVTDKVSASTISLSETDQALSGDTATLPVSFESHVGEQMNSSLFKAIVETQTILKQKALPVYKVYLYPYRDVGFVITEEDGVLRLNVDDDLQKTMSIFASAKKVDPLRLAVAQKKGIEYIDLRFGNKVFYKLTTSNETKL